MSLATEAIALLRRSGKTPFELSQKTFKDKTIKAIAYSIMLSHRRNISVLRLLGGVLRRVFTPPQIEKAIAALAQTARSQ